MVVNTGPMVHRTTITAVEAPSVDVALVCTNNLTKVFICKTKSIVPDYESQFHVREIYFQYKNNFN